MTPELRDSIANLREECQRRGGALICIDGGNDWSPRGPESKNATSRAYRALELAFAFNPEFQIPTQIAWGGEVSALLDLLTNLTIPVILVDDADWMFASGVSQELESALVSSPQIVLLSARSIWKLPPEVSRWIAYRVHTSKDSSKGRIEASPYPPVSTEERLEHSGLSMFRRAERTGDHTALRRAIDSWRELVQTAGISAATGNRLANLAVALTTGAEVLEEPSLWEEANSIVRQAIASTQFESSERALLLQNIGLCLAKQRGNRNLVLEGIGYLEDAAAISSEDPIEVAHALVALSQGLMLLYEIEPDASVLERIIALREKALGVAPKDSAAYLAVLEELVMALMEKSDATGDGQCLERAESLLSKVPGRLLRGSGAAPAHLANMESLFEAKYEHTGESQDLDKAIEIGEVLIRAPQTEYTSRVLEKKNLASSLMARYNDRGDAADLRRAKALLRGASTEVPKTSIHYPIVIGALANALELEYGLTGAAEDHQEALRLREEAMTSAAPRTPAMHVSLANAANSLYEQFVREGAASDLERAIDICQRALDELPETSPHLRQLLGNAATLLRERYLRTGAMLDLTTAEKLQRRACALSAGDLHDLPGMLGNLGIILKESSGKRDDPGVLSEAIQVLQKSLDLTPAESIERPSRLNNLAAVLLERYQRDHDPEDLDAAERLLTEAVASSFQTSRVHVLSLGNLASLLRQRSSVTKSIHDLDRSIAYCQEALALPTLGAADALSYEANLAGSFADRFLLSHDPADRTKANQLWRHVADTSLEDAPVLCLHVADVWCRFSFESDDWKEATEAYLRVGEASDRLARAQLPLWRYAWVDQIQGTASIAGVSFAKLGMLPEAVAALEGGRAKLISGLMKRNFVEMRLLEGARPDLHRRYVELVMQMRHIANSTKESSVASSVLGDVTTGRNLAMELENTVTKIRQVPGLQAFQRTMQLEDLQAVLRLLPQHSAFVYIVVTHKDSLALVVSRTAVESVWLPVTIDEMVSKLRPEGENGVPGYLLGQLREPTLLRQTLPGLLDWLGGRVMTPLAQTLRRIGAKQVFLCAPGVLSLLPLHAARYDVGAQERFFVDEFGTSYAPSAAALSVAIEELQSREPAWSLLGVADTDPEQHSLPKSRDELSAISSFFQKGHRVLLLGNEASKVRVRNAMENATHLHFACHGFYVMEAPSASGMNLSNGECLTLRDLVTGTFSLPRARIAVLSACQTALTDFTSLPEEYVGLPSGFLLAGVPAVLGTLWSVDDPATAVFMARFYEVLLGVGPGTVEGPCQPSEALRVAQSWMRRVDRRGLWRFLAQHPDLKIKSMPRGRHPYSHPAFWAPFVLVGL